MLNDGFDNDTVLRVTGLWRLPIWRLKAINLAEWSGSSATVAAMILASSARQNAAGCEINGAWAAIRPLSA